jgi:N-formylglutamate amidohydrolase
MLPALLLVAPPLDPADFLTTKAGTLPVVVSAPHGGSKPLPGVADRKGAGVSQFVTVRDTNTDRLAEAFAAAIERELGGRPFLVVAHFTREHVDANRPPDGAYESDTAKPVYDAYHAALRSHCEAVRTKWGRGLVLDLHAQGAKADTVFRGTARLSSLKLLRDRFGMAAITGPDSLLGAFAARGRTVFPGPGAPPETAEHPRYTGGYITRTYGAAGSTGLDAMQLEFGADYTRTAAVETTAADLAAALTAFAGKYLPPFAP